MKKENLKLLRTALLLGLIFSLLISSVKFEAGCEELKENILRLHIIANSDSEADQALKLKVRDAILLAGTEKFDSAKGIEDAVISAKGEIAHFQQIAEAVIADNGFDYPVRVRVAKKYFSTREYDTFTLPAGEYEALCVEIGEAKGKNWWCVMYPAICISAAADLEDAVSTDAKNIATGKQKYVIKFKTVEIFEEIKNFLKNNK